MNPEPTLQLPENVGRDTAAYRGRLEAFLRGQTSPAAFRAYRVPMGVYEQRAAGNYMVRVRIGAGIALPFQLEKISQLSRTYGNAVLHVTTRQDIQIHQVALEKTADVLEGLLEAGLSARGGGGNTVRNVTACPLSGVCPRELFDVAPYAVAVAEYLLQSQSSYNLPRKFKIAFSGCGSDCALASVADLGFFAHTDNGVRGFSVYGGGGLGANPRVAVKLEDFISAGDIFETAEAVKQLFDQQGDRSNKHKARLRYVVQRMGKEKFARLYRQNRRQVQQAGLSGRIPKIQDISGRFARVNTKPAGNAPAPPAGVITEKTPGLFTLRIALKLGDISADELSAVAKIADKFGCGLVRISQLQDLLISSVPGHRVEAALSALKEPGPARSNGTSDIIACTGAATCKLGLCLSRGLAGAVAEKLPPTMSRDVSAPVLRISGCPNCCGHHYIADIGFQGLAKRVNGRLMPCYDVVAGAVIGEGKTRLAEKIGTVPARAIPDMIAELLAAGPPETARLKELVGRHGDFAGGFDDEFYFDWGRDEPFSLAGRGPGECGAGVMDVVGADLAEAAAALKAADAVEQPLEKSRLLYKSVAAAARALLVVFGEEPKTDRQVFAAFEKNLIEPGWVDERIRPLLEKSVDWRMGRSVSIVDLSGEVDNLIRRVETLFLSLDSNLKFRAEPVGRKIQRDILPKGNTVDLRGVACPLNFVKAKLQLEKIDIGCVLEILLDAGEPVRNVPASFSQQGQEVTEVNDLGGYFSVKVRKKK